VIRHVVVLRWQDDATAEQRQAVVDGLRALPAVIPELRAYVVGVDAGLAEGNADLVVIGDVDDVAGWRAYMDHPAHQQVIVERIRPILAARTAIQIEL
jgi:endonuclease/exonuclease/phosphatase family metal-dependent hydrolase